MEELRKNKIELIDILMIDPIILQYVQKEKLVTHREYTLLKNIPQPHESTVELLDKMMLKGNDTCTRFVKLLQQPEIINDYPRLEDLFKSNQPGPSATAPKGPKMKKEPRKNPEKQSDWCGYWCGYIHKVSALKKGAKGQYFTAVFETEKEIMDVLILDLKEKQRFQGAAKRGSQVKLSYVSYEPLGVSQGKKGLKFTQKSEMSFMKKLPFSSTYDGEK